MGWRRKMGLPSSVHPHGRGDNKPGYSYLTASDGSPPRAWGQFVNGCCNVEILRFTPTGVGTISMMIWALSTCSVHPHGRGDNRVMSISTILCLGSPPRAWGQCGVGSAADRRLRFTPTGVGTMFCFGWVIGVQAVHPHGRGDNLRICRRRLWPNGSPPRAWGQCRLDRPHRRQPRFTPTGVGTIQVRSRPRAGASVHPHGRGDNRVMSISTILCLGSPPGRCPQNRDRG
jgi:hypothetical protein